MHDTELCCKLASKLGKSTQELLRRSPVCQSYQNYEDLSLLKRNKEQLSQNQFILSEATNTYSKSLNYSQHVQDSQENSKEIAQAQEFNSIHHFKQAQTLSKVGSNIQLMKNLLPKQLIVVLSDKYEQILKVAQLIDCILMQKMKYKFMESFENIKFQIHRQINVEIDISTIKKIAFLEGLFYRVKIDPLKNIVLGLPLKRQSPQIRRKRLRTKLYKYAQSYVEVGRKLNQVEEQIKESDLMITKTQIFYPKTERKELKNPRDQSRQKFIKLIQDDIRLKQSKINNKMTRQTMPLNWKVQDLETFAKDLIDLYSRHNVKHMYRASLIQWFSQRGIGSNSTAKALQLLSKSGSFLHSHTSNQLLIYQLQQCQKHLALALVHNEFKLSN